MSARRGPELHPARAGRVLYGRASGIDSTPSERVVERLPLQEELLATTWNMNNPDAFAAAGADEQEGGEPPPLAGAGVVVCLMG